MRPRHLPAVLGVLAALGWPSGVAGQSLTGPRLVVGADAGLQVPATRLAGTSVVSLYEEAGSLAEESRVGRGLMLDVSARVHVTRRLAIGLTASFFSQRHTADITGRIPHPFYFDQLRTVTGTASGLARRETGLHPEIVWTALRGARMHVQVFGGPTIVLARQDMVWDLGFEEAYPYDSATYAGVTLRSQRGRALGAHGGVDVTVPLSARLGVGALLRYSRTSMALELPDGASVSTQLGGLQAGAGLRMGF